MPGRNLWNDEPDSFRDQADPELRQRRSEPQADEPGRVQRRHRVPAARQHDADRQLRAHQPAAHDRGPRRARRTAPRYTSTSTPAKALPSRWTRPGLTPVFNTPKPKRQYDALELSLEKRFSNNWFGSASYVYSRLYGNYAGLANSDEISTPTTNRTSATPQQQAGSIARPGSSANRAWDLDELVWDSHGNLDVLGRLATDRPHVVKLYGAYMLPTGTQLGAFFYGGSGTPISRTVYEHQLHPDLRGRTRQPRPDADLSQTDLLVSQDIKMGGIQAAAAGGERAEPLQPEDGAAASSTASTVRGGPRRHRSAAPRIWRTGYDYNALLDATPDGANARRSALPDGRPLQSRSPGATQREVHVLTGFGLQATGSGKSPESAAIFVARSPESVARLGLASSHQSATPLTISPLPSIHVIESCSSLIPSR